MLFCHEPSGLENLTWKWHAVPWIGHHAGSCFADSSGTILKFFQSHWTLRKALAWTCVRLIGLGFYKYILSVTTTELSLLAIPLVILSIFQKDFIFRGRNLVVVYVWTWWLSCWIAKKQRGWRHILLAFDTIYHFNFWMLISAMSLHFIFLWFIDLKDVMCVPFRSDEIT